jgi:hypothetical protein
MFINVLQIFGLLVFRDASVSGTVSASSFIQQDVRQWALAYHEDFEGEVKGWNTEKTNSCDGVDHHLGGHCNEIDGEVKKNKTKSLPQKKKRLFGDSDNFCVR